MKKYICIGMLLSGAITAQSQNTYTIGTGTNLVTSGAVQLVFESGNLTNNGTFNDASGIVNFAGAVTYSGTGTTSFNNIIINHASGTSLFNAPVLLSNTLSLTTGNVNANGNITITPWAAITGNYANISGTVILQQNIIGQRGFRVFANPFTTGQTIATVASGNGITINTTPQASGLTDGRTFSNATNTWSNVTGTTFAANTPYALFIRGLASEVTGSSYTGGPTAFTYSVSGTLNSTNSITPASTANFLVAGNPYAAPVNTQALTGGTARPYYTYQILQGGNTTAQRTKAGSWVAAGSNSSTTATIPVLGVLAYQPASTSLYNITASDINTTGTAATNLFGTEKPVDQLELLVEQDGAFQDKLFVRLDAKASNTGTDNNDLVKFYNDNVNVYTKAVDGKNLAIDARSNISSIPIGISALAGTYNFRAGNNTLPAGSKALLFDRLLNTETELSPGSTYSFTISSDTASKGENRFILNFSQKAVVADNPAITGFTAKVLGNITRGNVTVLVAGSTTPVTISVVDMSGKIIKTVNATNGLNIVDMGNTAAGIHLLQVSNGKESIREKVMKN